MAVVTYCGVAATVGDVCRCAQARVIVFAYESGGDDGIVVVGAVNVEGGGVAVAAARHGLSPDAAPWPQLRFLDLFS